MRFSGDGGKFDAARDAVAFLAVLAAAVLYNRQAENMGKLSKCKGKCTKGEIGSTCSDFLLL